MLRADMWDGFRWVGTVGPPVGSCAPNAQIRLPSLAVATGQRPPKVRRRLAPKMWTCELLHAARALRAATMSFSGYDKTAGTQAKIRRHIGDTCDTLISLRRGFDDASNASAMPRRSPAFSSKSKRARPHMARAKICFEPMRHRRRACLAGVHELFSGRAWAAIDGI